MVIRANLRFLAFHEFWRHMGQACSCSDTYRVATSDMGGWLAAQVPQQIRDLKRRGQGHGRLCC